MVGVKNMANMLFVFACVLSTVSLFCTALLINALDNIEPKRRRTSGGRRRRRRGQSAAMTRITLHLGQFFFSGVGRPGALAALLALIFIGIGALYVATPMIHLVTKQMV
jgi:hypothetical protein